MDDEIPVPSTAELSSSDRTYARYISNRLAHPNMVTEEECFCHFIYILTNAFLGINNFGNDASRYIRHSEWPSRDVLTRYRSQDPVNVVLSTREIYEEKAHLSEVYPMTKRIHGRCLLLMNAEFPTKLVHDSGQVADDFFGKRRGTYTDLHFMSQLFQQLGFIVVRRINKTAMEMNEYLEMERQNAYHEVAECFVCVISTYGTQRHIFGKDGGKMTYRSILQKFDDFHCPALKGKPKLFFIQSAYGAKLLKEDRNGKATEDEAHIYLGFVPSIDMPPDMFLLLPTIPGFHICSNSQGSVLLEAVVYIFERWAHKHDIQTLVNAVSRLTRKFKSGTWFDIRRHVMAPTFYSTMEKKLYFFPGQYEAETIEPYAPIPEEIRHMSPDAIDLYLKILETGVERRNNIRLMLVGLYAAGKTSLTRRLMGRGIDDVESTDGIEIHKGKCTISLEDGTWSTTITSERDIDPTSRLAALVRENSKDGHSSGRRTPEGQNNSWNDEVTPPSVSLPERNILDKIVEYVFIYRYVFGLAFAPISYLVMLLFMDPCAWLMSLPLYWITLIVVFFYNYYAVKTHIRIENALERQIKEDLESVMEEDNFGIRESVREKDAEQLKNIRRIIEKTSSKAPAEKKTVTVGIWDFAGQFIYYSTHQLFLSPRAIYIVVLKLTNDLTDRITDDIWFMDAKGKRELHVHAGYRFWLRSLYSYGCGSSEQRNVILVGTHKDKIQGSEKEKAKQIKSHFDGIRQRLQGNAVARIVHEKTFAVSNLEEDPSIPELRQTILNIAKSQPYWNEELPAKWIQLEDRLLDERGKGKFILTFDDVVNIDSTCPAPIYDRRQLKLFLTYQTSIGNLVYYDQEPIQDTVVLDPQWIANAFCSLVADVRSSRKFGDLDEDWIKMTKTAIMDESLAIRIWKTKEDESYTKHHKQLLIYMEKLSMISKATVVSEYSQEEKELSRYFIPCLLKNAPDESFMSCLRRNDLTCSPVLCFVFNKNVLPPSVFHRLLAACIAKWPVSRQGQTFLIFCGCGVFDISTEATRHRLTILHLGDVVAVKISLMSTTKKYLNGSLCDGARRFIESTLNNEFRRFRSQTCTGTNDIFASNDNHEKKEESSVPPFKCRLLCPDIQDICLVSKNEGLIDVEELLSAHEERQYSCVEHSDRPDPHVIGTRDLLKDWFPDKVGSGSSLFEATCKRLEDFKEQEFQKPLSDSLISKIAGCIGEGWKRLGNELGLSRVEIYHVREDNPHSTCDQIYQMLMVWVHKSGRKVTFAQLMRGIIDSACEVNEEKLKNIIEGIA